MLSSIPRVRSLRAISRVSTSSYNIVVKRTKDISQKLDTLVDATAKNGKLDKKTVDSALDRILAAMKTVNDELDELLAKARS